MELLPESTRSKLRSTTILTSLPQVVIELVQNSLDANATAIEVGVNVDDWSCWVRDNGVGIHHEGLESLAKGLEERRYATSKAYSFSSLNQVSTFGFRGEALASMADLACLEITSRTVQSRESWSVILKGPLCLYNGPSIRWSRNTPGTVVHVRDAFYSLPIRRLSHLSGQKTLDLVRKDVVTLALVSPSVTFTIDDNSKTAAGQTDRARILSIPKTSSMLATFRQIHGRTLAGRVEELDETLNGARVQGFISLEGALSKTHQYLYLNRHSLALCDLHRAIEIAFSNSSFSRHALESVEETEVSTGAIRRSPRKAEKRPVYVLNITLPRAEVDNCLDPAKAMVQLRNRESLCSMLVSLVQGFLFRNGFATRLPGQDAESPSPRKKRRTRPGAGEDDELPALPPPPRRRPTAPAVELVVDPGNADSEEVVWTDPQTGQSYIVDMATGNSYPMDRSRAVRTQQGINAEPAAQRRRTLGAVPTRHTVGAERPRPKHEDAPEWIRKALGSNQVFPRTERQIRQEPPSAPQPSRHRHAHSHAHDLPSSAALRGLTADALRHAHVIDQVDTKFIACVLERGAGQGRALVLVDQHAADERVRVERFLAGPCLAFLRGGDVATTRQLEPPKPVLLSAGEAQRIASSEVAREAFRRWGVAFLPIDNGSAPGSTYTQVHVESVPEVVAEKLLMGDELQDFVRTYLAEIDEAGSTFALPPVVPAAAGEVVWQKALRWYPRALVNLVNSRACRGAIMFNDPLSRTRCERLVRELAETALPLQCAHGRPSIAPIHELGPRTSHRRPAPAIDWARFASSCAHVLE